MTLSWSINALNSSHRMHMIKFNIAVVSPFRVKQSHSIMSQTLHIFCPIITQNVLSVMMLLLPCGAFNLQLNQQQFCLWIAVNFFIAWWWKFEADMRVFHHWCLAGWLVFVRRGNKSEFCRLLLMLVRLMNVIWRSARLIATLFHEQLYSVIKSNYSALIWDFM